MPASRKKNVRREAHRICNLVPSKNTDKDWVYSAALGSGALKTVAKAPASVDLRASWWSVADQGNTGSCVGWASTDGVMRYHLVAAGKLGQKELLSPRFTWMASKETDEFTHRPETFIEQAGTSLKAAMDICRKFGVVPETMLPFKVNTAMYSGDDNLFFAAASQRKATAYFNMQKNFTQWRGWLASHGPILAGLNVDATWDNATANKGKLDKYQPATARGGHAICIVGYTKDGRFIIRNSWGTGWGDGGFAHASQAYITGAFFNESYGVTI